jgi:hypothetical protein
VECETFSLNGRVCGKSEGKRSQRVGGNADIGNTIYLYPTHFNTQVVKQKSKYSVKG